ncbi:hypothetical protein ACFQZZ_32445 [Nocardia sp. GCM10030253]|uniref:hypothetical protein n=1 Tax=Nocardia sp. GCM10030253 TaxID=3273404 RepID=UPI0036324F8D
MRQRLADDQGRGGRNASPKPPAVRRRLTQEHRAAIASQYEAGSTVNQLVIKHRLGKGTVLAILRTAGAKIRSPRRLTQQEIDHAINCYQTGESLARVGARFDVTADTISAALERRGIPRRDTQGRER